jgi:REP element-mobilizing transposase RayT
MRDWQGQPHVKWYYKYHLVFVPKYRRVGFTDRYGRRSDRSCGSYAARRRLNLWRGMRYRITSICI